MATYETYGERYRDKKTNNSKSVSRIIPSTSFSPSKPNEEPNQLGNVVAKISDRVDGIEIKIVSMTNIIKLLQKYTEKKDQQYEKQKQNQEFCKSVGDRVKNSESREFPQFQTKVKQFQLLSQRMKSEISAIESLRIGMSRENLRKSERSLDTNLPHTISSPLVSKDIMPEIQVMIGQLEGNLREQLNKKIQICMNYFKTMKGPSSSVSNVNTLMLEEEIHNLTLNINKLQNDTVRNKLILDAKFEELIRHFNKLKESRNRSVSNHDRSQMDDTKSVKSSRSKKSKSKSKHKVYNDELKLKISEQKKIKENELKEALKRKKESQQKLRMKK